MVVALTDVEIAVSGVSAGSAIWTHDRDVERINTVLPELQRYQPA